MVNDPGPHQNVSTMLENGDCSYSATQSEFLGNGNGQLKTAVRLSALRRRSSQVLPLPLSYESVSRENGAPSAPADTQGLTLVPFSA